MTFLQIWTFEHRKKYVCPFWQIGQHVNLRFVRIVKMTFSQALKLICSNSPEQYYCLSEAPDIFQCSGALIELNYVKNSVNEISLFLSSYVQISYEAHDVCTFPFQAVFGKKLTSKFLETVESIWTECQRKVWKRRKVHKIFRKNWVQVICETRSVSILIEMLYRKSENLMSRSRTIHASYIQPVIQRKNNDQNM